MLRAAISLLARRPALAVLILFFAGVAFSALPSLVYGPPLPALHDEYGYLFLGETFAQGRLTNPPPPGPPEFYATFHEFITPRYEAKFPPGNGVALALGDWLGSPIIGIWLVNGLWAVALYWMLRAAAPPGWALAGAVAGMVGYGAMTYWSYSYWGGSVLALGGALAFGGALRLWRRRGHPLRAAAGAGVGCGIMALTRPLDGFIFALLPAALILGRIFRDRPAIGKKLAAFLIPALLGVGLMLGYNQATTGSPLAFAHRRYDETYLPRVALFVWQKPAPDPPGQPAWLARYEDVFATNMSADPLSARQYWANVEKFAVEQFKFLFPYWIWPLAALGVLGVFARGGPARLALLSLLFIAIPLLTVRFYAFPHYIAAWTAPALVLFIQGARRLAAWGHRRNGLPAAGSIALLALALWPMAATGFALSQSYPAWSSFPWVYDREKLREDLADRAQATGHKQLALVVYAADHDPHAEWVFNSPDPAAQDVLWLRALGAARVPELARWFPGYDEWLVYVKANGQLDRSELIKLPPAEK
ncbi:MAG TPA: hypothetical protein VHC95_05405 [Opitutales bacterium]|nr:hypothetical protein [Opitutales bacterium]